MFETLGSDLGLTNVMQAPKIEKIIVNVGTGSRQKRDRVANDFIATQLMKITGQSHQDAEKCLLLDSRFVREMLLGNQ